jgi:Glycosyl hydrolases family 39
MALFLSLPWAVLRTVTRSRLFVGMLLLSLLFIVVPRREIAAAATTTATITVTPTATGTMQTQMSTNNVWSGMIDQTAGAQQKLNALHAPLVRIHVGDDGYPEALPDLNQGQWNFSALDSLVNNVTKTGQQPLMNIKFAPDWMWTCYPNSIGVSANSTQGTGAVKDLTFQTYAAYMARVVSYYNTGSMTTESGTVIANPAGTKNRVTYWEPWNEPDLNNETPCAPSNGVGITPAQYVTMWNAVTQAMLAVDPTIKFVGPATSGGQFGSTSYNEYVTDLLSGATVKPAAISFHGYGYWDNSVSDQTIFDGDSTGAGGIANIVADTQAIHSLAPSTPLWIDEVNVNAAWGNDPHARPWNAFSAAWWGSLFTQEAPLGVAMIHQYDVVDAPQFGLIDDQTGAARLPYWEQSLLNSAFPPGSTMVSSSSSTGQVQTLAAQRPDGLYSVLVVNRQLNSSTTVGGAGLPATVTVNLQGMNVSNITLQQIDATTSPASGPASVTLPITNSPQISFGGYGLAVLTITDPPGGSTPTPTLTSQPTSTPIVSLTATVSSTATSTPKPTSTSTPGATSTATPTSTPKSTATSVPSPTVTSVATPTATPGGTGQSGLTFIGQSSAQGNFGGGIKMKVPADQSGDLLVAVAGTNGSPSSWTAPVGWNVGAGSAHPGGQGLNWWWKTASGSEGGTNVTLKSSAWADGGAVILDYRGATANPIVAVSAMTKNDNGGVGNVTTPSFAGVSWPTSTKVAKLILSSWQASSSTVTWPSGYTLQATANDGFDYATVGANLAPQTTSSVASQTVKLSVAEDIVPTLQLAIAVN